MAKFSKKQQTLIEESLSNWRAKKVTKIRAEHTVPEKVASMDDLMLLDEEHHVSPVKSRLNDSRYNDYYEVTLYYNKADGPNITPLFESSHLSDEGKKLIAEVEAQYNDYEKAIFLGDEQEALKILKELE